MIDARRRIRYVESHKQFWWVIRTEFALIYRDIERTLGTIITFWQFVILMKLKLNFLGDVAVNIVFVFVCALNICTSIYIAWTTVDSIIAVRYLVMFWCKNRNCLQRMQNKKSLTGYVSLMYMHEYSTHQCICNDIHRSSLSFISMNFPIVILCIIRWYIYDTWIPWYSKQ